MSSDWINKAKEAAKQAADEAKKLAESAKNANYGEMFDKTKSMAKQAAEEAKKAAGNIMNKDNPSQPVAPPAQPDVPLEKPDNTPPTQPNTPRSADPSVILERAAEATQTTTTSMDVVVAKLGQVENILKEIKQLLQSK